MTIVYCNVVCITSITSAYKSIMHEQDSHKINMLIDKLTLEALALMEQHIMVKIQLEQCMVNGEGHIAKARYIMGHQKVSQLQLPTEATNEFQAMGVVNREVDNADVIKDGCFDLQFRKASKSSNAGNDGDMMQPSIVNPISWFGILVPQSLHLAQERFKQSLQWAVKSMNVQLKLLDCLKTIAKLQKRIN